MFRSSIRCPSCDSAIEKKWSFCPACGCELKEPGNDIFSSKKMRPDRSGSIDISDVMEQTFKQLMPMINKMMTGGPLGTNLAPFMTVKNQKPRTSTVRANLNKSTQDVSEVVEPEDHVSESNDLLIHSLILPGVKSKSDVTVTKLENSIEIRARAGKRLYMKIIKREGTVGLVSEEFNGEVLSIILKKA